MVSIFDCLDSKIVFAFEYAEGSKPSADGELNNIISTMFFICNLNWCIYNVNLYDVGTDISSCSANSVAVFLSDLADLISNQIYVLKSAATTLKKLAST